MKKPRNISIAAVLIASAIRLGAAEPDNVVKLIKASWKANIKSAGTPVVE